MICLTSDDADKFEEPDDGGGSSDCHYEPGGCEENPNPDDPIGDGGSRDNDTNNCPTGEVGDSNGNCVTGEVPCVGKIQ